MLNYCGLDCENCIFRAATACRGCGTPFYGNCAVHACAKGKRIENCGACADFPCKALTDCANDPLTGDGGKRIEVLQSGGAK